MGLDQLLVALRVPDDLSSGISTAITTSIINGVIEIRQLELRGHFRITFHKNTFSSTIFYLIPSEGLAEEDLTTIMSLAQTDVLQLGIFLIDPWAIFCPSFVSANRLQSNFFLSSAVTDYKDIFQKIEKIYEVVVDLKPKMYYKCSIV